MRAFNHAMSAWCGGLAVISATDAPLPLRITFAVATTGAALLPDGDSPKSTIAHVGGGVTRGLAKSVNAISTRVYQATATPLDDRRRDGHRGLTHTGAAAIACGLLTALLSWLGGGLAVTATLLVLAMLARRSLFGRARRFGGARVLVPLGIAVAALLFVSAQLPPGLPTAALLGGAVTLGMLLHDFGDFPTDSGVPLLWPLTIRGRRWFRCRLPKGWALRTGGAAEYPIGMVLTALGLGLTYAQFV